jgi:putative ABC transport system permease protein
MIARLAWLDLWHEWVLTLCMVLALAAVLAPLLLLLGLKYGTVQTLRERLVEDPVNREIQPARTLQLAPEWFDSLCARPEVAFVLPTILRGSSVVGVIAPDGGKRLSLDLVPTASGDPLILDNQGVIPGEGECVLTYPAAEELQAKIGDPIRVEITRTRDNRRESETLSLRVAAVLNPRADALPRVYARSELVNDVEAYRDGLAVAGRGWAGGEAVPFLSYDGLWIVLPHPLDALAQRGLTVGTGLVEIEAPGPEVFAEEWGFPPPAGYAAYRLLAKGGPVQVKNLLQIKDRLRGKSAILLPLAQNLAIQDQHGQAMKLAGLSLSPGQSAAHGLPVLPWGEFQAEAGYDKLGQVIIDCETAKRSPSGNASEDSPKGAACELTASAATVQGEVRFPLRASGAGFGQYAIVPAELLGVLRTARFRGIEYRENQGFSLSRAGYRGFRLYARGIDDVPALYRDFIGQKIEVLTQVQEIEKLKILDQGLTRIFWLVAIVGIVGGMAALIASLYAAVERKKRDISVLRLMGLSRLAVFQFPIYQGVTIALFSVIAAIGAYAVLASVINLVFSDALKLGEKMCTLPESHFILTFLLTLGIAAGSSLLAAWKTTRIDPAEAIREE